MESQLLAQLAFPITNMFTNISYVAICIAGGRMAIDGTLLIGSVQAFCNTLVSLIDQSPRSRKLRLAFSRP